MTIDHSWHDKSTGKIDHSHARGRFGADALDAMVLDRDVNVVGDLARFDVKEATGLNRDREIGRASCRERVFRVV